ncbi:MAG TPA: Glu/Leu/Phe/Val dehydrogenase [Conexivisphaerales archaeon]|nr:Glu/Leu/Phe/Val dehydrogenase [Conexivisphaerales archaeon]
MSEPSKRSAPSERLQDIDVWSMADEWGPEKVIQVYDPDTGMQGVLVIDNTASGPGKGGIRFSPTVTPREVFRLARVMTWKVALAGLPFGGAKAGIRGDPAKTDRAAWVRAFARAIKPYVPNQYVGATDMGTSELEMAVFAHEVGDMKACTGKPSEIGGIPHELGTTGYGVAHATNLAVGLLNKLHKFNLDPREARVCIQGFGNVGSFTAKFLDEMGFKIVGISDVSCSMADPRGLDIPKILNEMKQSSMEPVLANLPSYSKAPRDDVFGVPCDIFIPAATSDVINDETVRQLLASKVRMVVEAANIPTTKEADAALHSAGVWVLPDLLVNAGGVIGSYVEYKGGTEKEAFDLIEYKISKNTEVVIQEVLGTGRSMRSVSEEIAQARVKRAMMLRKGDIDAARRIGSR